MGKENLKNKVLEILFAFAGLFLLIAFACLIHVMYKTNSIVTIILTLMMGFGILIHPLHSLIFQSTALAETSNASKVQNSNFDFSIEKLSEKELALIEGIEFALDNGMDVNSKDLNEYELCIAKRNKIEQ